MGLCEIEMKIKDANGNELVLVDDRNKIKHMLKLIGCNSFKDDDIEKFVIERIGRPRNGYNHVIKVKLASTKERNDFIQNAKILKTLNEPWKNIFIQKDLHPVYITENNHIRKKYCQLKEDPENVGKEIEIENGMLTVNQEAVDRNTFFR